MRGGLRARRVRAPWRLLAAVLVVLLVVGTVLSWHWFVRPDVDEPIAADAIVVFGGAGRRFERGVDLAEQGLADVIVISDPIDPTERYTRFGWFCRNRGNRPGYPVHDYEALCFDPETDTTRGEARYVAALAEERGWERINLVTSTDQALRARMLLERCWDGEIASITVPTDEFRPARVAYEWAATARAAVLRRDC